MNAPVYFNNPAEAVNITPVTFYNESGTIADPASVTCVLTDPSGAVTSYTYGGSPPNDLIVKTSVGDYSLTVTGLTLAGLYNFSWIGTGNNVQQVTPGSVRLWPYADLGVGRTSWYIGMDELKSRIEEDGVTADDYELTRAIQVASGWINRFCGTHFNQITEARTFAPEDIYNLPVDQHVPGSITSFLLDYDGDFVYETSWTQNVNYQVYREASSYNINDLGIPRPHDWVEVLLGGPQTVAGGQFFPFTWPFSHRDRVKITATWGWSLVPAEVTEACFLLATDLFKSKDSPYGIAGVGDLGAVRVQASPWIGDMLRPYRFPRRTVGM